MANSKSSTPADKKWAGEQISQIIGTTPEDAEPLADFLCQIDNETELQSQMLDMLGSSPLALQFATDLVKRRFPPIQSSIAGSTGLGQESDNKWKVQSYAQSAKRVAPSPSVPSSGTLTPQSLMGSATPTASASVANKKMGIQDELVYFAGIKVAKPKKSNSNNNKDKVLPGSMTSDNLEKNNSNDEQPKSRRQLRREQEMLKDQQRKQKEAEAKRKNRKRERCECQATVHALITNCLRCGRIICEKEGEGPCMFCKSMVGDQSVLEDAWKSQLRDLLLGTSTAADAIATENSNPHSKKKTDVPGLTRSVPYSMKVGGSKTVNSQNEDMWVALGDEPTTAATDLGQQYINNPLYEPQQPPYAVPFSDLTPEEQEEALQKAFDTLGITGHQDKEKQARKWWDAERRKNRLLEYDQTSAQRSRLIDETNDFDLDKVKKWMTPEERILAEKMLEKQQQKREEEENRRRRVRVLHLDLETRTVRLEREKSPEKLPDSGGDSEMLPAAVVYSNRSLTLTKSGQRQSAISKSRTGSGGGGTGEFAGNPLLLKKNQQQTLPRFVVDSSSDVFGKLLTKEKPGNTTKSSRDQKLLQNLRMQYLNDNNDSDRDED
ncbi:hypothetical protein H4219_003410 [Mycoemilia scoparia]|uniref:TRIP4/RQT4 C2HC5-type zinc finger domain-containing protein n=1 Tax=Mycoemilia scoparia TaxID=417184 RepID=A0A9W8DPA1_9FUNG|nr:hypothetical protein H4219_003410 [Mycoemilia scoparia]